MNKKILVGSIVSVVILILVSFTSVVGHNSIESDKILSPLFNIRSSRAIDEENEEFSCAYVGQGEETSMKFPPPSTRDTKLQKVIDVINRMDKKTFNRFVNSLINHHSKRIKEEKIPVIINILNQLKINPDKIKIYIANEKENELYTEEGFCETVDFIWIPEC